MPKEGLTREEVVEYLTGAKVLLDESSTWQQAKSRLQAAGRAVGYRPAFRVLVMGMPLTKDIKLD